MVQGKQKLKATNYKVALTFAFECKPIRQSSV